MEVNNLGKGDSNLPIQASQSESTALDVIRTETVLSRLPVHNLAKKGRVDIRILKTTATGEVELKWEVSYNERYGQARQLAYKLDTIIINRRIDEVGKPLPGMIRIGSLNEICGELGSQKNEIKRALQQNATTAINAKLFYRGADRSERQLEALFTRYSVIFTGEKLPSGRKADAIYIILNKPYREVLDNAPVRPLDREYMKWLPPAAQRFYEIVSYKMFAALKHKQPVAKLVYSEYCTFSAQRRSNDWDFVRPQMWQVHKPHVDSGYLAKPIRHEATIDNQGNLDWIFFYTPGPKAYAEFAVAHGGRKIRKANSADAIEIGDHQRHRRSGPRQRHSEFESAPLRAAFDPQLVAEFTSRGIAEKMAYELIANVKPGQDVIAQLEHAEYVVENSKIPIPNPPGYIVRLIQWNTPVPDGFETRAKRQVREERERKERESRAAEDARQELEDEYERYCSQEVEQYIEQNPDAFEAIKEAKAKEERERYGNSWLKGWTGTAPWAAKTEIRKQLPLPTLEEFLTHKKQGTGFSLKLVAVAPAAEIELMVASPAKATSTSQPAEVVSEAASQEVTVTDQAANLPATGLSVVEERGDPVQLAPEPATNPGMLEPAVELVAEFPPQEQNGNFPEAGMV